MNGQMMLGIQTMSYSGRVQRASGRISGAFRRNQRCRKVGNSDDVGGKRCHRVRTGRVKIDGIRIREGRNASRCSAAATTASMRARARLCLGLRGGRTAV